MGAPLQPLRGAREGGGAGGAPPPRTPLCEALEKISVLNTF